ncbi:Protein strawberry notch-like protein 1 [Hypsibius exemplaris]|uniref:Protein strawberry notch-like protein 1 n=1 Tax=Hypsibius exemplaris TaxID=2072580 RepID=A0A1W0WZ62_HYPEX|nr:Protein strawberry notch-like protein 1 [Hypsibius exemplaris]
MAEREPPEREGSVEFIEQKPSPVKVKPPPQLPKPTSQSVVMMSQVKPQLKTDSGASTSSGSGRQKPFLKTMLTPTSSTSSTTAAAKNGAGGSTSNGRPAANSPAKNGAASHHQPQQQQPVEGDPLMSLMAASGMLPPGITFANLMPHLVMQNQQLMAAQMGGYNAINFQNPGGYMNMMQPSGSQQTYTISQPLSQQFRPAAPKKGAVRQPQPHQLNNQPGTIIVPGLNLPVVHLPNQPKLPSQQQPQEPEMDPAFEEDDDGGMVHGETYDQYKPSKLALGVPHPDPIVETLSLASVNPPDITYQLALPEHIGDDGMLSSLQLEAIVYACQKHELFLGKPADGPACRAGYLIGDGAGVGKGRTIAGIIYENWLCGRKKAIWISVSNDLKYDAERDLEDIGANIDVHSLNKSRYAKLNSSENGNIRNGVMFVTYPCLIGESMNPRSEYGTRMKQLMKWCGKDFDGVLVFDECHRAKNLCPSMGTKPTKTGLAVLDIQKLLPKARIVYASATGASEPRNMAYMTRLGLWGPGTPFEDFFQFTTSIEKRGVSAMELIAMDMKLRGMYIARQLSFSGVTFDIKEVPMDPEYCALYDDCVELWTYARKQFGAAAALFQADPRLMKQMWGQFWGSHQRFFKYLCLSSKVKATVQIAKEAIRDGKCVVIGLQSTGEARTLEQLEDNRGVLNDFVSTSKAVFQSLVDKHFPAFDRRRTFELVGITDTLMDDAEAALDEDPDEVDSVTGRPKRRGRHAASYKIPSMSEFEDSTSDDGDEEEEDGGEPVASSSVGKKRKAGRPPAKKTQPKKRQRKAAELEASSGSESSPVSSPEPRKKTKKQPPNKKKKVTADSDESSGSDSSPPPPPKTRGRGRRPGRKARDSDESSDSPFEPSDDSDEEGSSTSADDTGVDSNAKTSGSGSDSSSDVSDCSDEDNPWVKMLEVQRQARQATKTKKRKANQDRDKEELKQFMESEAPGPPGKSIRQMREEAMMLKQDLLDKFNELAMRLPNNTLDDLVDRLGGPSSVAEMTGRKGRVVTTSTGTVEYEARNDCDVALELLNLAEKQRFMDGDKLIAIISEAASSGISLQADRRAKNQRRRVHITLELPWSADRAIQQFGRTHRSNQISAPEYMFLITDLAGEKRFASAVAKRLECLGALTHGDRRATDSRDLSGFNIDSKYGRAAVEKVLHYSAGISICPKQLEPTYSGKDFFRDTQKGMIDVGMLTETPTGRLTLDKDVFNIGKFLNRLLGMKVELQNSIFQMFTLTMESLVDIAKREGRFEMGILELGFGSAEVVIDKKLTFEGKTPWTKAQTFLYTLAVERGLNWEDAKEILNEYDDKSSGFYLSNHVMAGKHTVSLAVRKSGQRDANIPAHRQLFCIYRPNSGMQLRHDTFEEVKRKGKLVTPEKAAKVWKDMYDNMSRRCVHSYWAGNCKAVKAGLQCDIGIRRRTYTVLAGSVLSVWPQIGEILYKKDGSSKRTQNVRVRLPNNTRIVGIIVPNGLVERLLSLLKDDWTISEDEVIKVEHLSDDSEEDSKEL